MWTQFQCFGSGATIFLVVPVKGRPLATASERELCPSRGRPFVWKNMNPFRARYKGAPPIWEWPPGVIIIYILILSLMMFFSDR